MDGRQGIFAKFPLWDFRIAHPIIVPFPLLETPEVHVWLASKVSHQNGVSNMTHQYPSTIMNHHEPSSTIINHHQLPSTIIEPPFPMT